MRREAAKADLRPRLTVQFVAVDASRAQPAPLSDSAGDNEAAGSSDAASSTVAPAVAQDAVARPADEKATAQQALPSTVGSMGTLPASAVAAAIGAFNGSVSEVSDWVQGSAASSTLTGSSLTGKALLVGALSLLAFCVYVVRRALARRRARTSGPRPAAGGRLNRFLARRRTAEPNPAKP